MARNTSAASPQGPLGTKARPLAGMRAPLAAAGFAGFMVLLDFLLWGGAFLPRDCARVFAWEDIRKFFSVPTFALLGLALVAVALTRVLRPPRDRGRVSPATFAVGAIGSIGSLAVLGTSALAAEPGWPQLIGATVLAGCGLAAAILSWQSAFATLEAHEVPGAVLVGSALFPPIAIACTFLPRTAAYKTAGAIGIASFLLLGGLLHCSTDEGDTARGLAGEKPLGSQAAGAKTPGDARSTDPATTAGRLREGFAGWRDTVLCLGSLGLVVSITRTITVSYGGGSIELAVISLTCIFVAAAVLGTLWLLFKVSVTPERLYEVSFLLIATGLLIFSIATPRFSGAFSSVTYFFLELSLIMATIQSIGRARERKQDPIAVSGLLLGAAYAMLAVGTVFGDLLHVPGGEAPSLAVVVVVCIYALSIPLVIRLRRRPDGSNAGAGSGAAAEKPTVRDVEEVLGRNVHEVCESAGLTAREEEVIRLVVIGRDVPTISEELCVSENTVRSHKKNAYRKLGVHSKQEIITLLHQGE